MYKYPKIETVFERDMDGAKQLIYGRYRDETVEFLKDCEWVFTEKIDGTNIGIYWDGHKVNYQGRTEKAQIPKHLMARLEELFGGEENEQIFEQLFGEKEVVLFGEGFGDKIQKRGSEYIPDGVDFILFDVYFPSSDVFLRREGMVGIAAAFGIRLVPIKMIGDIQDAIYYAMYPIKSSFGTAQAEGIVGKPCIEVRDRTGKRVIVKLKYDDLKVFANED